MTKINRELGDILSIILNMRKTYTGYFHQVHKKYDHYSKIPLRVFKLQQDLYISNEKAK